jgi:hypothetical protein
LRIIKFREERERERERGEERELDYLNSNVIGYSSKALYSITYDKISMILVIIYNI